MGMRGMARRRGVWRDLGVVEEKCQSEPIKKHRIGVSSHLTM